MYYYEVLVAAKGKTNKPLTYSSESLLHRGQIIKIPVRNSTYSGLILKEASVADIANDLLAKCRKVKSVSPYRLPESLLHAGLDFSQHSALSLSAIARLLLSNAAFRLRPTDTPKEPRQDSVMPRLNAEQKRIYEAISQQKAGVPQLLLGINGSGKTLIYAKLAEDQIKAGKSALILAPEIGLSAQILALLHSYLNFEIRHYHSQMSTKQKKDLWAECLTGEQPLLVVGPRSAEFLPLKNLGLIVLDEFHDDSFKQENQPTYHSLHFSSCLAKTGSAKLLCGSATPRVEDFYHFEKAGYPIHRLDEPALGRANRPLVEIVDKTTDGHLFSSTALSAITAALKSKHQALVFHNRRGHWQVARCYQCSWRAECRACSGNLVLHQDKFKLLCHGCGRSSAPPSACPDCRQAVIYGSPGIKTVVSELKKRLAELDCRPDIWRFDSDNPQQQTLGAKLEQIKQRRNLVIVGTQVVGQGLDLPRLQTVVITDAEQSLITPDYRDQEKFYRQIHQLSGRVGRGHLAATTVVIQTRQPENAILNYALKQNWLEFYEHEIALRRKHQLPPFVHFANMSIRRTSKEAAKKAAGALYKNLNGEFPGVKFYQPAPALQEKHPRYFEWLIHASSPRRKSLIKLVNHLKSQDCLVNLDPGQLFAGSN